MVSLGLSTLSGILFALTLPPFHQTWLGFFALIPFLFFIKRARKRSTIFWGSALVGLLYAGTSLVPLLSVEVWWWLDTQSVFFEYRKVFLGIFLFLLAGVTGSLFFAAFAFGVRGYDWLKERFLNYYPAGRAWVALFILDQAIFLSLWWIFLEWVRRAGLQSLMWQELGISFWNMEWLRPAISFYGITGAGFLIVFTNVALYRLLNAWLSNKEERKAAGYFLIVFAFVAILLHGSLAFRAKKVNVEDSSSRDSLSAVAIHAPRELNDAVGLSGYNYYRKSILEALEIKPKIIILPENAIPFFIYDEMRGEVKGDHDIANLFQDLLNVTRLSTSTSVIMGMHTVRGENRYNSSVLIQNGHVANIYHKRSLLPLSELTPNVGLLKPVEILTKGDRSQKSFDVPGIGRVQSLICSEVFYRNTYHTERGGVGVIAVSGNDSIFRSALVSARVRSIAQIRALEEGTAIIISTKGEPATLINQDGLSFFTSRIESINL